MCGCYNCGYYIALYQQTNCKEKDIALFVQNLFPKEKVDFVGDIRIRTHKTWFCVITTQAQFQQG